MSISQTYLTGCLKLAGPLFVAPMAGGPTTPALVAETSRAGALGAIGGAYLNRSGILEFAKDVRQRTGCPFAINLFVPCDKPLITQAHLALATQVTQPWCDELGIPALELKWPYAENFDEQFEALLYIKPAAFSFIFGVLKPDYLKPLRQAKIFTFGTATSLPEALELEEAGVDGIILQGIEAGGHRGLFDPQQADPEIPILELLHTCRSRIKIPLVAAGGFMNASDMKQALRGGAQAVQLGTAFLACQEAGTSPPYRRKLLEASVRHTKTTRAFSGRLARGIENRFMKAMEARSEAILPFPAQNKFTRPLRNAATAQGMADGLSLWAGTGAGSLWTGGAADLVTQLFNDLKA